MSKSVNTYGLLFKKKKLAFYQVPSPKPTGPVAVGLGRILARSRLLDVLCTSFVQFALTFRFMVILWTSVQAGVCEEGKRVFSRLGRFFLTRPTFLMRCRRPETERPEEEQPPRCWNRRQAVSRLR